MAYTAGAASVSITPDFRDFHRKIGEQLDTEDAAFVKAGDKWGKSAGDAFTARFSPKATVKPDIDDTRAKTELGELGKTVAPKVKPAVDDEKAKVELGGLGKTRTPKVKPAVDDTDAKVKLADLVRTRVAKVKVQLSGLSEAKTSFAKAFSDLKLPALGAGAVALAPDALGAGLLAAGGGVSLGAAAAGIGAFAAVAVPEYNKVTKAQKALSTAQADYNKATTAAGRATALKAESAATDGLTASEKKLAAQLANLKSGWASVQKAEEPLVASAVTPWIQTVTKGMQYFPSVFKPAASAIRALGSEAETQFKAPFWSTFFTSLGKTGKVAITGFGDALGHMGDGLAHLFVTFAPDLQKIPGLVDKWATSFDNWAKHYSSSGLDDFFRKTFSQQNMASLKGDLSSLGTVFSKVATATENMSPAAFAGLSNVLTVLSKLTPTQIEALALIYGGAKVGQSVSNATSGLSSLLGLLGLGGKGKKGAAGAAGEAEEAEEAGKGGSSLGELLGLGALGGNAKGALGGTALGLLVADGILHLPGVKTTSTKLASDPRDQPPTVPGLGKLPQSYETPFNMPGPHDPKSSGNWLTSWSPYENFATKTVPKLWDGGYQGFMTDIGSPVAAWFDTSLPHFFTSTVPKLWSGGYEGFERNVGSPVANWFDTSLPHFFTKSIPGTWSGLYQGFMKDAGSPIAHWFDTSLPHAFGSAGSWLTGEGSKLAHGLGDGFSTAGSWVGSEFGKAKSWATSKLSSAGSWLRGKGRDIGTGLGNGWSASRGWVTGEFGKAKSWVTGKFSGSMSWLRQQGRNIGTGLGNGWNSLSSWVGSQASKGKGWITSKFSGGMNWLRTDGRDIATGLGNGWNSLGSWVESQASKGKGWITSRFSGSVSWLRSQGSSAARGLGNGWASMSGWVRSEASKGKGWVTGAFSGAGSWLVGVGESIMRGLANGLSSAASSVEGILRSITSKIPSWKGPPAVDAKLLAPAGTMIMQGLADSLADGIPGVRSVLGQTTREIAAGLNVPAISLPDLPRAGADGSSLTVGLTYDGPQQGLVADVVKALRADIGAKSGGNVQKHLGRGPART